MVLRQVLHRINSIVAGGTCIKFNEMGVWKMNERIRELMEQAGFDPDAIQRMGVMPQAEKFAELIVQEAMVVTKTYTSNQGLDYSAPVALSRHFGVGQ